MTLTNESRTATRTFWFVVLNGKPVARLCKQATGFARWSVLKGNEWKQFASRDAALAYAAI